MRDEPISVYGDGSQVRAFTYAPDTVGTFLAASGQPAAWDRVFNVGTFLAASGQPAAWDRVFNVGSCETTTVLKMADAVRTAMGVPDHPIKFLPARDEVHAAYTDNARARKTLGDWADTPLTDGLLRTADWARRHGPVTPTTSLALETADQDQPGWFTWASGRTATR